jgi:ATP-dependent Clp protease adapter protein ClpS
MPAGHSASTHVAFPGPSRALTCDRLARPKPWGSLTGVFAFPYGRHGELSFYTSRRIPPVRIDPESSDEKSEDPEDLYEVRIIDNEVNTYGEVMQITMASLGISEDLAFEVAWEVDHAGSCVVAHAPYRQAEAIASMIRTIGIEVQVNRIENGPV